MVEKTILIAPPLIDRIGATPVNIALAVTYTLMCIWGVVAFLVIPSNPNVPWPLAHAFVYVLAVASIHGVVVLVGKLLVPGFRHYTHKPRWLYVTSDTIFALSFASMLVSYPISSTSSTVPLLSTFSLLIAEGIYLYKLFGLVSPVILTQFTN